MNFLAGGRLGGNAWTPYKATVRDGALFLTWLNYVINGVSTKQIYQNEAQDLLSTVLEEIFTLSVAFIWLQRYLIWCIWSLNPTNISLTC